MAPKPARSPVPEVAVYCIWNPIPEATTAKLVESVPDRLSAPRSKPKVPNPVPLTVSSRKSDTRPHWPEPGTSTPPMARKGTTPAGDGRPVGVRSPAPTKGKVGCASACVQAATAAIAKAPCTQGKDLWRKGVRCEFICSSPPGTEALDRRTILETGCDCPWEQVMPARIRVQGHPSTRGSPAGRGSWSGVSDAAQSRQPERDPRKTGQLLLEANPLF